MGILEVSWETDSDNIEDVENVKAPKNLYTRVPRVVKQFDITMRKGDRDIEADYVFIAWLARKRAGGVFPDGGVDIIGREEGRTGLCVNLQNIEEEIIIKDELGPIDINDFFADPPYAEDYDNGEEDEQYLLDYVQSVIKTINAKNLCKECPIRAQCLADSILLGDEDKEYGVNSNVRPQPGVWGGRDMKERKSIARKFKAVRNEYLSGEMAPERKRMYERKAMSFIEARKDDI